MASELKQLLDLATEAVAKITKIYEDAQAPLPTTQSDSADIKPDIALRQDTMDAANQLHAACAQMTALTTAPAMYTVSLGLHYQDPAALRIAIEAHVAEALRNAGPQGLHVNQIAKYSNINPEKLSRILRYLATRHIFKEVSRDTFANNRQSLSLDTGKDPAFFAQNKQEVWYEGTNGVAAFILLSAEDMMKPISYLPDVLQDSKEADTYDPGNPPCQRGLNFKGSYWDYFTAPGNEAFQAKFNAAMTGSASFRPHDGPLQGVGWANLPEGSVCVDVGGGVGTHMLPVTKAAPHLKIVVQDQPPLEPQAVKFWEKFDPNAISSGRVKFQPHDFFKPQQTVGAAIYYMRYIMHDWPDKEAIQILRQIRAACSPTSKLILVDAIVALAYRETKPDPVYQPPLAPAPLLPNYGVIKPYGMDLQMLLLFNALERTFANWKTITQAAGFKIVKISGDYNFANLTCEPI